MRADQDAYSRTLIGSALVSLLAVASMLLLPAVPAHATFPGKIGKIAFVALDCVETSEGTTCTPGIHLINPGGTQRKRLTSSYDRAPAWSPDGRRIAFSSRRDGNWNIYTMNMDGGDVTRVTSDPADDHSPAWSPDGDRIAFTRGGASSCSFGCWAPSREIYAMNADGTDQTRLTNNGVEDSDPAWSPDGTSIAFGRYVYNFFDEVTGSRWPVLGIFRMRPDGTNATMITSVSAPSDYGVGRLSPDWSPDGTRIAFERITTPAVAGDFNSHIYTVLADGSAEAPLATNNPWNLQPSWSPDGTSVAYSSGSQRTFQADDIYVANSDGEGAINLTETPAQIESEPAWQPAPNAALSKSCKGLPGHYLDGRECLKREPQSAASQLELVGDIRGGAGASAPSQLTSIGGTVLFTADDGAHGRELWRAGATERAGAAPVKDINPGPGDSAPSLLTVVGRTIFFVADDGVHGRELWKSDGSAAGTNLVKDIKPGAAGSYPNFRASGTLAGTVLFGADDGVHGSELWRTDGTAAGTMLVADINPGPEGSYLGELTRLNGRVFFMADDGLHGYQVWRSDGTAAGTALAVVQGCGCGEFSLDLSTFRDSLILHRYSGGGFFRLYASDGTGAGTVMLASGVIQHVLEVGGKLLFLRDPSSEGLDGAPELWRTDGTVAGTTLVTTIVRGREFSTIAAPIDVNGTLYFFRSLLLEARIVELWKSDGSAAGTTAVETVGEEEGPYSRIGHHPANVDGTLFFGANGGGIGTELWRSDGTAAGTNVVRDLNPGAESAAPRELTNVNGTLYFTADDGLRGRELWKTKHPVR